MNPDDIKSLWEIEEPVYQSLGHEVVTYMKAQLPKFEIMPEISFRTKELISIIKKIQRKSKSKTYNYNDLKDKLGIRIICPFSSELEIVDKWIKEHFQIEKAEYKKDELDYDKLDYTSNHYDLKVKTEKFNPNIGEDVLNFVFELQVRSINQHAWSSASHILTYKSESKIPKILQRKVYRLLSLYEIADDEFSNVNKQLNDIRQNIEYHFIRSLEGKIYKLSGRDFDRGLSLFYFSKLLQPFPTNKKTSILESLLTFTNQNELKFDKIFNENEFRLYKIPVLSQPEIFLIFFMMDFHPNVLDEVYSNELDYQELENLRGIWA